MRAFRFATIAFTGLALGGCVIAPLGPPPVVATPGQGKTFEAFQADDGACRQFAKQQIGKAPATAANQSFVGTAALGTALGAAAGAAIGAAAGNPAAGAAIGAASGLGLGAITGTQAAQYSGATLLKQYDISYAQCMTAKGQNVQQLPPPPYPYYRPLYGFFYPYGYYYPYDYPPYRYGYSWDAWDW